MHVFDPIPNVFLDLGFVTWYKYSLMILIGLIIAILLGLKEGKKLGISANDIIDGVIIVVPLSIIGTRLWYVIFEWQQYAGDLISIFRISDGGLAIHGGFITAIISSYFYTKYKGINLFRALDIITPGF
jgi:phosphatidylglycerol:prolipoprotein diacylglycerol transferase